ncbi:hypothetical protein ACSVBT_06860 [Afipia sp. TerB]
MPVESRDDLVKRLRDRVHPDRSITVSPGIHTDLSEAATRIESDAKRIAELEAERINHIDYSVDLQRIIEDVCHSRPVRIPKTTARYHYDLAVGYRQGAIAVDRALAEERERHQWRTIDSAPKDKVLFVRRDNGCGVDYAVVWWADYGDGYPWQSESNAYPEDRWDEWFAATAIRSGKPDGKE